MRALAVWVGLSVAWLTDTMQGCLTVHERPPEPSGPVRTSKVVAPVPDAPTESVLRCPMSHELWPVFLPRSTHSITISDWFGPNPRTST